MNDDADKEFDRHQSPDGVGWQHSPKIPLPPIDSLGTQKMTIAAAVIWAGASACAANLATKLIADGYGNFGAMALVGSVSFALLSFDKARHAYNAYRLTIDLNKRYHEALLKLSSVNSFLQMKSQIDNAHIQALTDLENSKKTSDNVVQFPRSIH
jgi:hypothetical protein